MNEMTCDHVLDRLPDLAAGRIGESDAAALHAHLGGCADCAEAWSVVSLLAEAGPAPVPPGLEARLQAAVRADGVGSAAGAAGGRRGIPHWRLAAAAGIVLALATPVLMDRMGTGNGVLPDDLEVAEALTESLPSPWLGEDEGIVAGAPVLDGLSDEALEQLLEEMGG